MQIKITDKITASVFLICLLLEAFALYLAYQHFNYQSYFYMFFVFIANLIITLLFLLKQRKATIILSIILVMLTLPSQIATRNIQFQIIEECSTIMRYVDIQKKIRGVYPDTLNGYIFKNKNTGYRITYTKNDDGSYLLSYYLEEPVWLSYSYNYNSNGSGWVSYEYF